MSWPNERNRDGGIDPIPGVGSGKLSLCGKHAVGPDPEGALVRSGATTIVCLNPQNELAARYPSYVAWLDQNRNERAVWFPIPDLYAFPLDQMMPLFDNLQARLRAGEHLLVHCGAGIGRAGTVATCLLMLSGHDAADALAIVAANRPMAGPEVGAQRDLVAELEDRLSPRL